jgi:hypothetical protein
MKIFLITSLFSIVVLATYSQTATQVKQKIDDSITNRVAQRSVTAKNVGERMKEIVDFVALAPVSTLNTVTTAGNSTSNDISIGKLTSTTSVSGNTAKGLSVTTTTTNTANGQTQYGAYFKNTIVPASFLGTQYGLFVNQDNPNNAAAYYALGLIGGGTQTLRIQSTTASGSSVVIGDGGATGQYGYFSMVRNNTTAFNIGMQFSSEDRIQFFVNNGSFPTSLSEIMRIYYNAVLIGTTVYAGYMLDVPNNPARFQSVTIGSSTVIKTGSGSPEGVVTAPIGSLYTRTDGSAGSTLYVKESGSGNTGWSAK